MPKILYADLSSENCTAELWLNDIPVAQVTENVTYSAVAAPVYVVDGWNTLEIIVNPAPVPAHVRDPRPPQLPPENAKVTARLVALDPGQFTNDPNAPVLLSAEWNSGLANAGRMTVLERSYLGTMFGDWPWQAAPILQLGDAVIARVTEVLERIRVSLQAGDPSILGRLARPKFESAARAFPARSLGETLRQFSAVVTRNAGSAGWTMLPLEPDQFSFRLAAGGRLIECINKDFRATLRATQDDRPFPYYFPMFLGLFGPDFAVYV